MEGASYLQTWPCIGVKNAVWAMVILSSWSVLGQNTPAKQVSSKEAGSSYTPHMTFDVISIRESRTGHMSYIDNPPGSSYFHLERGRVAGLILTAYNIKLFQRIENLPGWAMTTPYDVTAKSDDTTDEAIAKLNKDDFMAEKRHMLQELLRERFGLRIHQETRIATVYELVTTTRTAKLMTPVVGDLRETVSTCNEIYSPPKGREIDSKGCPFTILYGFIQQMLGTDVIDHTGLSGMYAYHLMWNPFPSAAQNGEERYPEFQDAVSEQLGLKLKGTKAPVVFWLVDQIERPTPN